jgi:hypothetical protein
MTLLSDSLISFVGLWQLANLPHPSLSVGRFAKISAEFISDLSSPLDRAY